MKLGALHTPIAEEAGPLMTQKWAQELADTYINPDQIYQSDSKFIAFIYTKEGKVYSLPYDYEEEPNHINIIALNDDLYERYQKMFKTDSAEAMRKRAIDADLLGRVGFRRIGAYDRIRLISFWNYGESSLSLLPDCLKDFKNRGWIDDDTFVSTPNHKTVPVTEILGGGAKPQEMSDEDKTDYDLWSKLHLLRGQEKHDAMKKLRLGGGGKPHAMQAAMQKAGILAPGQKWWAPNSESALTVPGEVLAEQDQTDLPYINPDKFYKKPGAVPFIYTGDGTMYYGNDSGSESHAKLVQRTPELYDRYLENDGAVNKPMREDQEDKRPAWDDPTGPDDPTHEDDATQDFDPRRLTQVMRGQPEEMTGSYKLNPPGQKAGKEENWRDRACRTDLFGRINPDKSVASFWNTAPDIYVSLLKKCVVQMIKDGALNKDGKVSTPVHNTVPLLDLTDARQKDLSPEDSDKMELYKKLHLMRGQEKHEAMKILGVGGGGKPHAMQAAMQKAGLLGPGQKWWAMHSEAKNMPYHVKKVDGGYKVYSPNGPKSKKPLSKKKAKAQQAAIYANATEEDIKKVIDRLLGEELVTLHLDRDVYEDVVSRLAEGHQLSAIVSDMGINDWTPTLMGDKIVLQC